MNSKIETYNEKILDLFKKFKISSVTINDVLYSDFSDIPNDIKIEKIVINKKYIKLFDDEKFVIDNYINNKELLVKNEKTGRYIRLKISSHARFRLMVRYIILYLKYNSYKGSKIGDVLDNLVGKLITKIKEKQIVDYKKLKNEINLFINENIEEINIAIYTIFKRSSNMKNISRQFKGRLKEYGPTNYFNYYPFILVYDINTNLIKTIEISGLSKQDTKTKGLGQEINKKANDFKYLLNIIRSS